MEFKAGAGTGCQRKSQNGQICAVAMLSVQPTHLLSQADRPPPAATQRVLCSRRGCSWGCLPGPGLQPSVNPSTAGCWGQLQCLHYVSQRPEHRPPFTQVVLPSERDRSQPRCPPCLDEGVPAVHGDRRDERRPALRDSCTLCWDTRPLHGAATHSQNLSACGEGRCLAWHPRGAG